MCSQPHLVRIIAIWVIAILNYILLNKEIAMQLKFYIAIKTY